MTAIIYLAVTSDLAQITQGDYDACEPHFNDPSYTISFFADPATFVDCGAAGIQFLIRESSSLVRSGKTCTIGSVVQSVGGTDKCGRCHWHELMSGSSLFHLKQTMGPSHMNNKQNTMHTTTV